MYSLALKLKNTNVPVWTPESLGNPKMDINHWEATIDYGVQLAYYCDQTRSWNSSLPRSPPVFSLGLRLKNTRVHDIVWTHESMGYSKNWHQPSGRGNSLWRSACPILWSTRSWSSTLQRSPPVHSLTIRLKNTKVTVWTHEFMGYP